MSKYFYTTDYDSAITEDALVYFVEAADERAAKTLIIAELVEQYSELDEDILTIKEGSFSDCWFKAFNFRGLDSIDLSPFSEKDMYVSVPGTHPGGNCHWITPNPIIYVPVFLEK